MQVSNFELVKELKITLKITTKSLYLMAYSAYQKGLFEKVLWMREGEKLTYESIANRLTKEGVKSARNCLLMAEHVFSIYKKGLQRKDRLTSKPNIEVVDLEFLSNTNQ